MYSADADEALHDLMETYAVTSDNLHDAMANAPLSSRDPFEREDAEKYVARCEDAFQQAAEALFAHIEKQVNRT